MKFRFLLVSIFLILMLFFLAQCSPSPEPAPVDQNQPVSQPTEQNPPPAAPSNLNTSITPPTGQEIPQSTNVPPAQDSVNAQQLAETRCSACHSFDRVKSAKKTADEWVATVKRMVSKGAELNNEEEQIVILYLSKTYPK